MDGRAESRPRASSLLLAASLALPLGLLFGCGGGEDDGTGSGSGRGGTRPPIGIGGNVPIGGGSGTGTGTGTSTPTTTAANAEAFVTDALNGSVEVYDLQTGQWAASVPVQGPTGAGYDGGQKRVLVTAFSGQLSEIDAATLNVVATHDLRSGSHTQNFLLSLLDPIVGVAVRPMDVYAVNGMRFAPALITTKVVGVGGSISGVMDLDTSGLGGLFSFLQIPTGVEGIGAIAATQSGGRIYVANCLSDTVTVIDPALVGSGGDPVLATIPIGMSGGMAFPMAITADDAGHVYAVCALSGEVAIIDTLAQNNVTYIPFVGAGPVCAAFNPGTSEVYVGSFFDGSVVAIDTRIGFVVNTYQVSSFGSLFAAMGLSPTMFQQALQQAFGGLGTGQGGSSASSAANLILGLFSTLAGGAGGTGSNPASMITNLFSSLFGQAFPGQGGSGGLFGGLPVPGLTGLEVTRNGRVVATSALFGGCDVLDPNTGTVTSIPAANGFATGGIFPGWAQAAIHER